MNPITLIDMSTYLNEIGIEDRDTRLTMLDHFRVMDSEYLKMMNEKAERKSKADKARQKSASRSKRGRRH